MTRGGKITETHIKQQIRDYLNRRGIFNYHNLQSMGSYKGVPDRTMHLKGQVVYIEVKKPGGELSENQKTFQAQCLADGIEYWVVYSVEELIERVEL
jgi:hypothetical protein